MQAADGGTLDVRRSDEGKRNLKMKQNSSSNPFKGPTQQPSGAEPKSQTFINFLWTRTKDQRITSCEKIVIL